MNNLRWLIPITLVVMLLGIGAVASAAGTEPVGAPYVDNAPHSIAGNDALWYRFEYDGSHSQILVRLVNGKDDGVRFQVFAPSQMPEWWKYDGIGVGSPQGDDLVWSGNANEAGTWYIKLLNDRTLPTSFELQVTGEDVSFTPPASIPAQAAKVTAPSAENVVPDKAFFMDAADQVIPAKTSLWYRFPYDGTRDQVILKIPRGWENHLRMHIHTPSQMTKWWELETKPIGQGTPQDKDLIWSGNSNEAGWWYVEVMNDNPHNVGFAFNVEYQDRIAQPD
jgi:hypothetical protein